VFPALTRGHGLLLTAVADGRVFFVVPFDAHALVGTTEVEVDSPPTPSDALPTLEEVREEVRYLRASLARALPRPAEIAVLAVTAGVRPLLESPSEVGAASREHRVVVEGHVLTIAGGKYTTFRVMARDALNAAALRLGRRVIAWRDPAEPLPRPMAGDPPLEAQARFSVEHEMALRLDDVLRRRTRLWLAPDRGRVAAPLVAAAMARLLGWDEQRQRDELQGFHRALADEEQLLRTAWEDACVIP
jgi:glycerol-3-phosphate dehydrogenase